MPSNYTLVYFNARGRGEICRILFAASNTKYTDKRIEFKDWPVVKKDTPHGALPYLVIDGTDNIPQSLAIARYLAREFKFYGDSSIDAAKIDVFLDTTQELLDKGLQAFFSSDETKKKELIDTLFSTHVPKYLDNLEKSACGVNDYLVGNRISVADMYLYCMMENLQLLDKLDKYPKLKGSSKRVTENERIKAYIAKRPAQ